MLEALAAMPTRTSSFHFRPTDFIVVCIVIGVLLGRHLLRRRYRLPPGPQPLPVIGNLRDFPKGFAATHWAKHKELYGPISSVHAFGKRFIIVNDLKVATDLFEKRSVKYSGRPASTFAGKMCGFDAFLAGQQPGDKWRGARKRINNFIGTRAAVSQFNELLELEGRQLVLGLLVSPTDFFDHLRSYAGAIILKLCFDYSISRGGQDPLVGLGKRVLDAFSDTHSGLWLVDVIPALKYLPGWLPGMGFKRVAERYRSFTHEFLERPYNFAKSRLANGVAATSFISSNLESSKDSAEEQEIQWITATLYGGGSDTTVSASITFILAMTLYPEVLRKAQAEVDSVIGTERLPQLSDRPSLPYIEAIQKESLRWNNVAPLSVPRAMNDDDEYNGYLIPKGSIIYPNIWQMCHDPSVYHDPFAFKPERFLPKDGFEPELDPRNLVFGFGRRICPGKELADASLFVAISTVLATMNITKALDSTGKVIEPDVEYLPGVVSRPKEFQCAITPRSEAAAALIRTVMTERAYDRDDSKNLPEWNAMDSSRS